MQWHLERAIQAFLSLRPFYLIVIARDCVCVCVGGGGGGRSFRIGLRIDNLVTEREFVSCTTKKRKSEIFKIFKLGKTKNKNYIKISA